MSTVESPKFLDIPIFPLPNVVLFPRTVLPLHIFEPRYRQMTAHCLKSGLPMGISLLKPGAEEDQQGDPSVFEIGSAGTISRHEKLEDGRYHILLAGKFRYRIQRFLPSKFLYRQAVVELIPEAAPTSEELDRFRSSLLDSFAELIQGRDEDDEEGAGPETLARLDFETLVNTLCSALRIDPSTRQKLLELDDLRGRAGSILDFMDEQLELRRLANRFRHLKPEDPSRN